VSDDTTLPKQELLAKLLRMTTQSNDGEVLTAIRKANALLTSAGWDWDKLLAGKIKIVENPFAGLGNPLEGRTPPRPQAPQNFRPAVNPQPAPAAAAFQPKPLPVRSTFPNKFPNHCWGCAREVPAQMGWIFKPQEYNQNAIPGPRSMWEVLCTPCNNNMMHVTNGRAFVTKKRGKATINDLA
jgi:hypothetical protein